MRWCLDWSALVGYRSGEMGRETLQALDQPALVDLVLELQRANAALTARVAELETRLAKLESPPKTPGNSSVNRSNSAGSIPVRPQ